MTRSHEALLITPVESPDSSSVKSIWRKALKERLSSLTSDKVALHSQAICQKIYYSAAWSYVDVIALFAGLPGEPQLRSLAELAWVEKKTVLFPKIDPEQQKLTFFKVEAWNQLQPGAWGIWEPTEGCRAEPPGAPLDLICVPGLGFDRRGARLGRGKGFYDRFLCSLPPETIKLGVFFALQEIAEIPEMSHDCRLDGLVTEQELFLL